jgi:hypothetical protein
MSTYAWVITRDHLAELGDYSVPKRVGVSGPRDATDAQLALAAKGRAWRVLDDDGEIYYSGRIWAAEPGSDDDFGPLDDFGAPDAGATEIQYRSGNRWETL